MNNQLYNDFNCMDDKRRKEQEMKLTQEVDYAFRIVSYLMNHPSEVIVAAIISEEMHVPLRFLLKILRKLNMADITTSKRGARGGYLLKDPKRPVTYYEVIEAIQGPITINRCLYDDATCVNNYGDKHCPVHYKLHAIQDKICTALKEEVFLPAEG